MARRGKKRQIIEKVEITDIAAEGKSLAKIFIPSHDGTPERMLVVFVAWCVPGDIVDVLIKRKKHNYAEGEAIRFHHYSEKRIAPACKHFGICGGCKWQQLPYQEQLLAKQKQVYDQLTRIGHITLPLPGSVDAAGCRFHTIIGSEKIFEYRNKLDFGCANKRYLTPAEIASLPPSVTAEDNTLLSAKNTPAIGFHVGGAFDKILPIEKCHLMDDFHNRIRNAVRDYAVGHDFSFYDIRAQHGLLRDIIIRNSNSGEWMVILQFKYGEDASADEKRAMGLMKYLVETFPEITSLMYVDNQKCNDTISDLPISLYHGKDYIVERMEDLRFKVGPKSFYQTNTEQAYRLYSVVRRMAFDGFSAASSSETGASAKPLVYDLYTGTGTIANFVASRSARVVGIEYVPEAIEDAKENSRINKIDNTLFFAGDMKDILSADFISQYGRPDIIITDPPRAGMHPDVVKTILTAAPKRIVYVSCNPATQARDLSVLLTHYYIIEVQPVDMFPHTTHVENVVLLEKK